MIKLVWQRMVDAAVKRINKTVGWNREIDTARQIAMEIVASDNGETFLKAGRRGRPGRDRTLRLQIVKHVEDVLEVKKRKPRIRPKKHLEDELPLE